MLASRTLSCLSIFTSLTLVANFPLVSHAQVRLAPPPAVENHFDGQSSWHVAGAAEEEELELTPDEKRNILVYERGNRAVVHITTRSVQIDNLYLMERPAEGSGSGSILDKRGLILTNYHVIEGARDIRVTLFNGDSYAASLVGQDPVNDIAVLKIDASEEVLFPVRYGDSSKLRVGQKVYAIGNPFGLERTMTIGIISSLNRVLPSRSGRTMKSIIQIDAALNRGNSGGPLFDSSGRLIGMNTAIASRTGENTGVGFAIPISAVKRVVPQLVENGRVIRPDIGITRVYQTDQGLMVATIAQGGPVDQAGIRGFRLVREQVQRGPFVYEQARIDRSEADTIVGIDGQRVQTADDLLSVVENKKPGEQVVLTVVRDGETVSLPVTLGAED
ncbi:S1C family serine protease [Blastopirellula marina]|uniref:Serine protease n=1 Tax=Blastopirellula marina TaxID=124 RepID=A0A2S8FHX3_9BACT|nr:trypsin-like peptidase domain-containing protein [Blastopirellula marina]PQO31534.1 serine protease [Blastopirellula marina]PTL42840.1 PDZ domain-containing protein [Blastopirellula marina]